jgi:hypothetical protein
MYRMTTLIGQTSMGSAAAITQMVEQTLSLPSGGWIGLSLDLTTLVRAQITLTQLSYTQDFSVRAWISVYPNGIAVPPGPWPVLRTGGLPILVYTDAQMPMADIVPVPLAPAQYTLNLRNLTNEDNLVGYSRLNLV